MTKYITRAIFNGTKLDLSVSGRDVNAIMSRLRRKRELRNASVFLFISRRTGKIVDSRFN